jgi:hypothetical protein
MHLVGFTIEIYYDARHYERQKYNVYVLFGAARVSIGIRRPALPVPLVFSLVSCSKYCGIAFLTLPPSALSTVCIMQHYTNSINVTQYTPTQSILFLSKATCFD